MTQYLGLLGVIVTPGRPGPGSQGKPCAKLGDVRTYDLRALSYRLSTLEAADKATGKVAAAGNRP